MQNDLLADVCNCILHTCQLFRKEVVHMTETIDKHGITKTNNDRKN